MEVFLEGRLQVLKGKNPYHLVIELVDKKRRIWISGAEVVSLGGIVEGVRVFVPDNAPDKVRQRLEIGWSYLLQMAQIPAAEKKQEQQKLPVEAKQALAKKIPRERSCFRRRW